MVQVTDTTLTLQAASDSNTWQATVEYTLVLSNLEFQLASDFGDAYQLVEMVYIFEQDQEVDQFFLQPGSGETGENLIGVLGPYFRHAEKGSAKFYKLGEVSPAGSPDDFQGGGFIGTGGLRVISGLAALGQSSRQTVVLAAGPTPKDQDSGFYALVRVVPNIGEGHALSPTVRRPV